MLLAGAISVAACPLPMSCIGGNSRCRASRIQTPCADRSAIKEPVAGAGAYFGHLPPPSMIRAYEAVRPGTGEWLLRMAEQRIQQRRQQALDALAESYRWKRLVAWMLFGTALAVLAAAIILSAGGHSEAAIRMVGGWTTVVAIVACIAGLRRHHVGAWSRPENRDKAL